MGRGGVDDDGEGDGQARAECDVTSEGRASSILHMYIPFKNFQIQLSTLSSHFVC